jgi:hypothetical protein
MKRALAIVLVSSAVSAGTAVAATEARVGSASDATLTRGAAPLPPTAEHPTPILKLSYVRFSIGNADRGSIPLEALHLDLYPLSRPWVRAGLATEAGRGQATLLGNDASLGYGLLGISAGVQIPGRVTPFLEGQASGGVLAAHADGPLTVPGTTATLTGGSAATWIYGRGLNAGVEVYAIGRAYVSASLGWIRTTWGSPDTAATIQSASTGLKLMDVTHDSFLLKVGLGV